MDTRTNLEEYSDPFAYDAENDSFEPDGPFYLTLAQRIGGSVLEVGCGTGRITIPLAQQGIQITGLDIVPQMLERARSKAASLPIRWVEADVRSFDLGTRFHFIFETGAVFQHLHERLDQEAMLERVRDHLEPDGRFVVGSMFPNADLLKNEDTEQAWFSYTNSQGHEEQVSGTQHYDELRQIRTETAYRRWRNEEGREILKVTPLRLRFFYPQEMEALLHYNGFTILERYGDSDFSPLTNDSRHMIYVCGKR